MWLDPWVSKIPWRRAEQPTLVFLSGESHGQRSMVGYSLWGREESDITKRLSMRALSPEMEKSEFFIKMESFPRVI